MTRPSSLAVLAMCLATSGCATLERGSTDSVFVLSDPPGAKASASIVDHSCVTPCAFDVDRQADFTVTVEKDGFATATVDVKAHSVAPASATSHELTADYVARLTDAKSGANFVHDPDPVNVTLKKNAP